ncbi:MAG: hypothetical protein LBJ00_05470 [Planctomycetaceae bacterium]|nr:hypothetical protein [Planctomycetaceae bacterium]
MKISEAAVDEILSAGSLIAVNLILACAMFYAQAILKFPKQNTRAKPSVRIGFGIVCRV